MYRLRDVLGSKRRRTGKLHLAVSGVIRDRQEDGPAERKTLGMHSGIDQIVKVLIIARHDYCIISTEQIS